MRKVRENIIVAKGNKSLFPANTDVYVKDAGGGITLNGVRANEIVIYDYDTGKSLSPGDTVDDSPRIVIAQGLDLNGDGLAEELRGGFGDKLYGDYVRAVTTEPPRCGLGDVLDIAGNCTHCDSPYAINITVEDDTTQNQYPYNRPATYTYAIDTDCCACDSCETGIDEVAFWKNFADRINRGDLADFTEQDSILMRSLKRQRETAPFHAYQLFANDYTFCLTPVTGACDTCNHINAITGIEIDNGVDDVSGCRCAL